ncbi:hypothetical protein VP1G_04115 [Cytospora mali]|uniref:Lpxtg-domain-containing protein n=1 Tax=Cytospora mali TaxID=578113 RepID=A0A194UYV2_CYTMA|nr:hypothetical protein VP1G_04115 [Valsa mali var. pyri (nom. inval.)]
MRFATARLTASAALAGSASAILVTQGSPCDDQCGNVLSATTGPDIECDQNNYGSAAGIVYKNCMNCELSSTYYSTELNQTDQQWLLYNARFALSYCMFGEPGNVVVDDSPCITSRACGSLEQALEYGNFSTSVGAYDYCSEWDLSEFVSGCVNCLRSSEEDYLANLVTLLQVGCDQQPSPGDTVGVKGGIFSTTKMNETTPSLQNTWTNTIDNLGPVSLGGKVGIAAGGFCFLLAVTGFFIVCNGRRRRRAFLRKLEMRQKEAEWTHPAATNGVIHRGPDMNETPVSQKPLRGWDDSPRSTDEHHFPRYFSPYSSQYNSPVSAAGTPAIMAQQWPQNFQDQMVQGYPSSSQEKAMQDQHEAATGTLNQPANIGVALGGDDQNLRTESSSQSGRDRGQYTTGEEYELHEVSSAGGSSAGGNNQVGHSSSFKNRMARGAPVLQHPGNGRYSPDRILPPPAPTHTEHGGPRDDGMQGENVI